MGIKSFFNGLRDPKKVAEKAEKKAEKEALRKSQQEYVELSIAITAGDAARVKELVDQGVNIGFYFPETAYNHRPMKQAFDHGNAEVFKVLLDSPQGPKEAASWGGGQSISLERTYYRDVYFSPYMLRDAIEQGKRAIALMLVQNEGVDVELAGRVNYEGLTEHFQHKIKPVVELAREHGMTEVVEAIETRMKPIEAGRRRKAAATLLAKADALREEAEKLHREADELHPLPKTEPAAPPQNKLKL